MTMLNLEVDEVEHLRCELCQYFCEEEASFKLDECISVVDSFCKRFIAAHTENKERDIQSEKAAFRKLERERSMQRKTSSPIILRTPEQVISSDNSSINCQELYSPLTINSSSLNRARSASCTRRFDTININNNKEDETNLLDILLKPSTNLEALDCKRFNSLRINRKKSRNTFEFLDRERSPFNQGDLQSASLRSSPVSNNDSNQTLEGPPEGNESPFIRSSRTRSSCPSRVQKKDLSSSSPTPVQENNDVILRVKSKTNTKNPEQLEKRLSREIALKAASYEQQIRELESSLDKFNNDLSLNENLNKLHTITGPKIQLSAPEKVEVFKEVSQTQQPPFVNSGQKANVKERMKRLTQLYSGHEPQEIELKKTHNYGREINTGVDGREMATNPSNGGRQYSDKISDNSFKDEGFDSEEFSNTSTSQKSSRNSSRERDSGHVDININVVNGQQPEHQPEDISNLNKNHKYFKQDKISHVNVKAKQIVDRSKPMSLATRNFTNPKITTRPTNSGVSIESQKTKPHSQRTNPNSTSNIYDYKSSSSNRAASKPASRVTTLAETKLKQENEKRIIANISERHIKTSQTSTPLSNKKRSISRTSDKTRESSTAASTNSTHNSTIVSTKSKPRSSSALGLQRNKLQSSENVSEAKPRHTRLDPITNLTASFLPASTKKQPHLSRDGRPKVSKPPPSSVNNNKISALRLSTLSLNETSFTSRNRTGSTSSTKSNFSNVTQKSSESSFVRGAANRSTMPSSVMARDAKSNKAPKTQKSRTLLDRPQTEVMRSAQKMARPIKPTMRKT